MMMNYRTIYCSDIQQLLDLYPMKTLLLCLSTAAASVLGACGGGGGTAAPVATPLAVAPAVGATPGATGPTVLVEAAIFSLYAQTHAYDRTETDPRNGNVYNVKATFDAGADSTIEGQVAKVSNITRNLTKNGAAFVSSAQTDYFQVAPYRLVATRFPDSPLYVVASSQVPLPATGKPGDTGNFYTSTTYDSVNKNLALSTSVVTWAINADTATTVAFCINGVTTINKLTTTTTTSDCYKLDTNGNVIGIGFTVPN